MKDLSCLHHLEMVSIYLLLIYFWCFCQWGISVSNCPVYSHLQNTKMWIILFSSQKSLFCSPPWPHPKALFLCSFSLLSLSLLFRFELDLPQSVLLLGSIDTWRSASSVSLSSLSACHTFLPPFDFSFWATCHILHQFWGIYHQNSTLLLWHRMISTPLWTTCARTEEDVSVIFLSVSVLLAESSCCAPDWEQLLRSI